MGGFANKGVNFELITFSIISRDFKDLCYMNMLVIIFKEKEEPAKMKNAVAKREHKKLQTVKSIKRK